MFLRGPTDYRPLVTKLLTLVANVCTIPDTNVLVDSPSGSRETGKNIHWYIALDADRSQQNLIHSQCYIRIV
jgi:hypothetical protein